MNMMKETLKFICKNLECEAEFYPDEWVGTYPGYDPATADGLCPYCADENDKQAVAELRLMKSIIDPILIELNGTWWK